MDPLINRFVTSIKANPLRFKRSRRPPENYFELDETPLIIKSGRTFFWGVGRTFIEQFNSSYENYFLIILQSDTLGWFFSKEEINQFIDSRKWKLRTKDDNYKIAEPFPTHNRFSSPDEFLRKLAFIKSSSKFHLPEEIIEPERFREGTSRTIAINIYERNPAARQACIEHYGYNCTVCGFNFSKVYGDLGEQFIHVHHLKQLSTVDKEYSVDPIKDLRPVCPNCHAMIHRQEPPLTIKELQGKLK